MKKLWISDAARVLQAHPETLRRWERKGLIKAQRDYRKFRVFDLQEVLKFKRERETLTEKV